MTIIALHSDATRQSLPYCLISNMDKMLSNARQLGIRGIKKRQKRLNCTPPFESETSPFATCMRISQIFHFENPQQQIGTPSSVIAIRSDFSMSGPQLWNCLQKAALSYTKHGVRFHILLDVWTRILFTVCNS